MICAPSGLLAVAVIVDGLPRLHRARVHRAADLRRIHRLRLDRKVSVTSCYIVLLLFFGSVAVPVTAVVAAVPALWYPDLRLCSVPEIFPPLLVQL